MKGSSKKWNNLSKKVQWKFFLTKKELIQSLTPASNLEKKLLFIIGCQRSGTTMMQRIFERDMQAKVYGEFSKLSSFDPDKIRLNPLSHVKREIEKDAAPLIVMKPLVETQNLYELFNFFPNSNALWMYRHYKDVAQSNLKNFGQKNGIADLRPIVFNDIVNWRSERVSDEVREVVIKHFSEDMNEIDAAALFWYVRNSLFFDLDLANEPRVMMFRYEDLVHNPTEMMKRLYDFVDCPFPGEKIIEEVSTSSVGKGKKVGLKPEIEELCEGMLERLNEVYYAGAMKN